MKKKNNSHYWKTLGLGAIAGMRAMSAPVFLSEELGKIDRKHLQHSPLRFLQAAPIAAGFKLLAAGELAGDKLPQMPDRINLPSLAVRTLSGALVGAALFTARRDSAATGALLGGLSALAATYGSFYLRAALHRYGQVPNAAAGLMEDAMMVSSGLIMVKK
ncbi:MAG: DUF4126 family protein [Adhaeribacter sp.]